MKKLILAAPVMLAVAACGDNGDGAASGGELPVATERVEEVAPPEGQQWSEVVSKTSAGGYMMGNPDAPVTLIEYGSLTCPACARFDEEGYPQLVQNYINSGRLNFEFRNYVRDPIDMTAALLARCGSEATYYPLTHALYGAQGQWFGEQVNQLSALMQQIGTQPPAQQFPQIAEAAGLKTFAAQRGVPASRADACLADQDAIDELVEMKNIADTDFEVPGTPAFYLDNTLVQHAYQWPSLEPALKAALGDDS
ncbi:thioredoxin domain-containing protein [Sphingomicrobium sediminis]|uniref:DsbA family protein n=1 Tax=Sphingomicrobium sediminis TaxID=2950949 RepID=A0A9X2EHL0_9SPHN|nr:thioredoxin domain-containing protein [Sphingomicrobium sediminis]MCM8557707.1 DsbA family protein [Sphingomicrobium sediminis]